MLPIPEIDLGETLRYMGCPAEQADPATVAYARRGVELIRNAITLPRWAWRVSVLEREAEGIRLDCGLLLPGRDLKAHLEGCGRAVLFCATLGAGVDAAIRRAYSGGDMALAHAADCAADAAIEAVCDAAEQELQGRFPGCFFPFRYSPGYGDLPLSVQNELLDLLDAPRRAGLCATESHIMTPRKSVTAVLGIAERELERKKRSCQGCPARSGCQYRKAGGHCGVS